MTQRPRSVTGPILDVVTSDPAIHMDSVPCCWSRPTTNRLSLRCTSIGNNTGLMNQLRDPVESDRLALFFNKRTIRRASVCIFCRLMDLLDIVTCPSSLPFQSVRVEPLQFRIDCSHRVMRNPFFFSFLQCPPSSFLFRRPHDPPATFIRHSNNRESERKTEREKKSICFFNLIFDCIFFNSIFFF